ncbi:MAG: class I SAM-dependent methyltransferase [Chloroflexota bacterium]
MDWHARYSQQANWTRDLRSYLFEKAGLVHARRVLEVGCGTGAILAEIHSPASLLGLDLNPAALTQCRVHAPAALLTRGDALALPYSDEIFDIVYCHFLLLWVSEPLQAVSEMKRVTCRGGKIIALAEPDYSARVDQPAELVPLGQWQAESLRRQGANPSFGAHLAETFYQAGIELLETGPIQGPEKMRSPDEWKQEWDVLESDLAGIASGEEIHKLKVLDEKARAQGQRILHVPTYFAWGAR